MAAFVLKVETIPGLRRIETPILLGKDPSESCEITVDDRTNGVAKAYFFAMNCLNQKVVKVEINRKEIVLITAGENMHPFFTNSRHFVFQYTGESKGEIEITEEDFMNQTAKLHVDLSSQNAEGNYCAILRENTALSRV